MAPKTEPGSDHGSDRLKAAIINMIAVIAAAIISALALVYVAHLGPKSPSSASTESYNSFSMVEACWVQHDDPSLTAQYENWNDPNSWVCTNSSGAVVGTVNIQAWCDHQWPGSIAVNIDNTAYGWRCRTLPLSLSS